MDWFKKLLGTEDSETYRISTANTEEAEKIRKDFLHKVTYSDVDFFHLNGYCGWAKIVKAYDGDTIHCVLFVNGKPFKFKFRLAHIDTAEKRSEDEAEVAWALKARDRLVELSEDGVVWVHCFRHDKYGRVLAELFHEPNGGFSFNDVLLTEELAYEYHGGTRRAFRDWAPERAWKGKDANAVVTESDPVNVDSNIQDTAVLERF